MKLSSKVTPPDLSVHIHRLFELATDKMLRLARNWDGRIEAPVVTVAGKYAGRNWTQWTQGFLYGSALLCFDVTGQESLLEVGRTGTMRRMAEHITHTGVHDHGFNNQSTFGQLRRLMLEGRVETDEWELRFYELALKSSGAVQASRWTALPNGFGYIYSFNGPHSLFIDTIRTLRVLAIAHALGHELLTEQDRRVNLLGRLLTHAKTAAQFNIYYGEGRDIYDMPELRGRTAHEAIFNTASGSFRCSSSQQGYSPFSTWTRGLAWAMLGFAEELEFVSARPEAEFAAEGLPAKKDALAMLKKAARATCDFYMYQASAEDGICYWDTGAPGLSRLGDWKSRAADPMNEFEPVDSSASAIAAQGLIRLGLTLEEEAYLQAGLQVAKTLFAEPYLSTDSQHEGILLHSIYHRPNGWDYIPAASSIPCGESSMWGDYHALELGLLISRLAEHRNYTFF